MWIPLPEAEQPWKHRWWSGRVAAIRDFIVPKAFIREVIRLKGTETNPPHSQAADTSLESWAQGFSCAARPSAGNGNWVPQKAEGRHQQAYADLSRRMLYPEKPTGMAREG